MRCCKHSSAYGHWMFIDPHEIWPNLMSVVDFINHIMASALFFVLRYFHPDNLPSSVFYDTIRCILSSSFGKNEEDTDSALQLKSSLSFNKGWPVINYEILRTITRCFKHASSRQKADEIISIETREFKLSRKGRRLSKTST